MQSNHCMKIPQSHKSQRYDFEAFPNVVGLGNLYQVVAIFSQPFQ